MPLQQDVTHFKTNQLVDRIRCEARLALESKIVTLLENHKKGDELVPWSQALAEHLKHDESYFNYLSERDLGDVPSKAFYRQYVNMAIALNFTFGISEENKASATLDFIKPFSGGTFTLGLSSTGDVVRDNSRNFVITERFGDLLHDKFKDCRPETIQPNFVYPISGSIGLKELIDTFVDLNSGEKLVAVDDDKAKAKVFADTLTFTTTLSASAGPKAGLVLAGRNLQVMDAGLTGSAMRTDKHVVIVGLSLPVKSSGQGVARQAEAGRISTAVPFATPLSGYAGPRDARQSAVEATNTQRFNTFLDRFGSTVLQP